jgi:hypothetical protein
MRRCRAFVSTRRACCAAMLSSLVIACDFGHADYALDLAVRLRIATEAGMAVPGAVVRLSEGGRPVDASPPICVSNKAGLCEGQRSYRFGRTEFKWWRSTKSRGGRLALSIAADGYNEVALRLAEMTREEVAGMRTIERDVVLSRQE